MEWAIIVIQPRDTTYSLTQQHSLDSVLLETVAGEEEAAGGMPRAAFFHVGDREGERVSIRISAVIYFLASHRNKRPPKCQNIKTVEKASSMVPQYHSVN